MSLPFDEKRYKELTSGLEVSEINYQNVITSSYSSRLDSTFFKKDAIDFSILAEKWELLSSICPNIKSGTTPSVRDETLREGIALLKTNDIRNNIVSALTKEQFSYIDEETDREMKSSGIKNRDVLINIVGATTDVIGRTSFVPDNFIKANITQAMARLRVESKTLLPEYLFVFLLTSYAKRQTNRIARQTGQFNMNLVEVGTFRVWEPSYKFQLQIAQVVNTTNKNQTDAQILHQESIRIIEKLLSMPDDTTNQHISIKSSVSSYKNSGRLDAEYYHPKYDKYMNVITNYVGGYTTIKEKFNLIIEKCKKNLDMYKYVEIGDVNVGTGTINGNEITTDDLPDNAKIMTKRSDIIVSTVRPNRGAVAILEEDNLLVSGAFTVLREKENYSKELLQILLRTFMYRDWLLRFNVGTSYPVIKNEDVLNMPIPLFDEKTQSVITKQVQQSFALRKQSEQLLEQAKRAVEMAIEHDEETAMNYLNKNTL